LKSVLPVYGQDFAPGYSVFTVTDNSFISDGIVWFQNLDESAKYAEILNIKGFSHVLMVVNEHLGIEAAEKGVQFCELENYFENPHCHVVCREPQGIDEQIFLEAYNYGLELKGKTMYDFSGILGFAFTIISGLSNLIRPLRKLPIPLHIPGTRFCSAFVADCYKHTWLYKDIQLFKDYHVTRIHPHKLWNRFPYKPFRFDKQK